MKLSKYLLLLVLLVGSLLASDELTFSEAKALAEKDRETLSSDESMHHVGSMGQSFMKSMMSCRPNAGSADRDVTFVFEIGADGRVTRSWSNKDNSYARCIRDRFTKEFSFTPKSAPFYTMLAPSGPR